MRKMLIVFLLISIVIPSCVSVKTIEIGSIEGIKINSFKRDKINIDVLLPINNPNIFKFKVKEVDLKVFIRDKKVGLIKNTKNIIINRNTKETYSFNFDIELSNILFGTIAFINSLSGNKIKLKLTGTITVQSFFIKREIIIDKNQLVTIL